MKCPNIKHKVFKEIQAKVGILGAYNLWINNNDEFPNPALVQESITNPTLAKDILERFDNLSEQDIIFSNDMSKVDILKQFVFINENELNSGGILNIMTPSDVMNKNGIISKLATVKYSVANNEYNIDSIKFNNSIFPQFNIDNEDGMRAILDIVVDKISKLNVPYVDIKIDGVIPNLYQGNEIYSDGKNEYIRVIANSDVHNSKVLESIIGNKVQENVLTNDQIDTILTAIDLFKDSEHGNMVKAMEDNMTLNSYEVAQSLIEELNKSNHIEVNKLSTTPTISVETVDGSTVSIYSPRTDSTTDVEITNNIANILEKAVENKIVIDTLKLTDSGKKLFDKIKLKNISDKQKDLQFIKAMFNEYITNPESNDVLVKYIKSNVVPKINKTTNVITKPKKNVLGIKPKAGKLESKLTEYSSKVKFIDSDTGALNPFTNAPVKEHYYIDETGTRIDYSGTSVVSEYEQYSFDKHAFLMSKLSNDKEFLNLISARTFTKSITAKYGDLLINPYETEARLNLFIRSLLSNNLDLFFSYYSADELFKYKLTDVIKDSKPDSNYIKDSKLYFQKVFDELFYLQRKWEVSAEVGTKLHRHAQAIMKEEYDRNLEDLTILNWYDSLNEKIAELDEQFETIKDELKAIRAEELSESEGVDEEFIKNELFKIDKLSKDYILMIKPSELIKILGNAGYSHVNKLRSKYNYYKSYSKYYNDLIGLKKEIHDKGGIIKTEFIVHTDKLVTGDLLGTTSMAGQIDMLVIFEDDPGVDPEYRNSVMIFDYKSMSNKPLDTIDGKLFNKKADGKETGYYSNKQGKHSLQLELYKKVIETELGLKVLDTYVIPIHVPDFTYSFDKDGNPIFDVNGNFGLFNFVNRPSGKIEMPFSISTKTMMFYEQNRKIAASRIKNFNEETTEDEELIEETEGEKLYKEKQFERRNTTYGQITNVLKIYVQRRLDNLKRNKNSTAEEKSFFKKMQNDLDMLENTESVLKFIVSAYSEIFGSNKYKMEGLYHTFNNIIKNYYEGNITPDRVLNDLDSIRIHAQSYEVLDDIKKMFDTLLDEKEFKSIKESEEYKLLEEAIAAKDAILNKYYIEIQEILADRLSQFVSKSGDDAVKRIENAISERIKEDIEYVQKQLNDATTESQKVFYTKRLEVLNHELIKLSEKIKEMKFDKESIRQDLVQASKDISWLDYKLISAISTNDKIIALYSKLIKFKLMMAEDKSRDSAFEVQKLFNDLESAVGTINTDKDDAFSPILEETEEWVYNDETKEFELKKFTRFISEFGTRDHKLEDGTVKKMSHSNIIKDYHYRLKKLYKENKLAEYRKLQNEYEEWRNANLENEYIDEFYEWKKSLDPKNKELLAEIDLKIQEIKDSAKLDISEEFPQGRSSIFLTEEEIAQINELKVQRKNLASLYDLDGNPKTDPEQIRLALNLQEFNKRYSEFYDFEQNVELFEENRKQVQKKFGVSSIKYKQWLENNTNVTLTDQFHEHYKRLRNQVKMFELARGFGFEFLSSAEARTLFYGGELDRLSDVEYNKLTDEVLEREEYDKRKELAQEKLGDSDMLDIYEQINNILKSYKESGIPNGNLASEEVQELVRKLQESSKSVDAKLAAKIALKLLDDAERNDLFSFFNDRNIYRAEIDKFIEYVPTVEYYKALEIAQREARKKGIEVTETEWFDRNHIYDPKEGTFTPSKLWTRILPRERSTKISVNYDVDKAKMLESLRKAEPGKQQSYYNNKLVQTPWYKNHHKEDGTIRKESKYNIVSADDIYLEEILSDQYRLTKVKESTKRNDPTIYDELGYLKPKRSLWLNPNYSKLTTNKPWFDFYNGILSLYKEEQKDLPSVYKMGNNIPMYHKSIGDVASNTEGIFNKFKKVRDSFIEENITGSITRDIDDKKVTNNSNIDTRYLYLAGTDYIENDDVNKNVVEGVLQFVARANRFKALSNIMGETRALMATVNHRESQGGGTVKRDSLGLPYEDAVAKRLGIDMLAKQENASNMANKLKEIIEMHIFDQMNIPYEKAMGERKFRVDKIVGTLMSFASYVQIGGTHMALIGNFSSVIKGMSNALMANAQLYIEAAANEFFTTKDYKRAQRWYIKRNGNIIQDLFSDYGKIANTSFTGQLADLYDPMQGEFYDKFGKVIPKSKMRRIFNSDMWFLNQRAGEYHAAMTSLFALLNAHKVVDGEVYNIEEYLLMKEKEKGSSLTRTEVHTYEAEFEGIENTLLDSYEIGSDGKIKIKDGVNWQIGSKRDLEMKTRLHEINGFLHGKYSTFNKTTMERSVWGRLLMMYKKYLVPSASRRFNTMTRNEALGTVREGYYRTFLRVIGRDIKELFFMLKGARSRSDKQSRFTIPHFLPGIKKLLNKDNIKLDRMEERNMRRAMRELLMIVTLTALVSFLELDDDEDKKDVTSMRMLLLYETERLRKELNALTFVHPGAWADNWKLLKSPSAATSMTDRLLKFALQLGDPFAVYERDSGSNEKGDSKLVSKFLKIFGNANFMKPDDIKVMYDNLTRSF